MPDDAPDPSQNSPDPEEKLPLREARAAHSRDAPTSRASAQHTAAQRTSAHRAAPVSERRALMQLSSAGFELAIFSLLLGGAGYAVDHWFGNATPYFAIAGIVLGFCLGFYRLIVLASKMN